MPGAPATPPPRSDRGAHRSSPAASGRRAVRQALLGGEPALRALTGDEPRDDGGDQARPVQVLHGKVRQERHREADGGGCRGVAHPRAQPHREPADDGPDGDGDEHRPRERADRGAEREHPRGDGQQGRPQQHEGGRIVQQALALEHRHDARRDAEAFRDPCRHGIRRAEDRAERDAEREPHSRQQQREEEAEHEGGHDDEHDGEPRDRCEVAPELDRGQAHRRGVQQRRENSDEDPLRVDLGDVDERHEPDRESQRHEQQRAGDAEPLRQRRRRRRAAAPAS